MKLIDKAKLNRDKIIARNGTRLFKRLKIELIYKIKYGKDVCWVGTDILNITMIDNVREDGK